ncbi:MAG: hypothetical protein K0S32_2235 [Bacteroidetes bacterium]|nr:hypothetical protein [Bacteroidota bacterium]
MWKLISFKGKKPGTPYAVSSLGRFGVMRDKNKVEVRNFKPQNGAHRYNFKLNGQSRAIFVYKEVARAFVKQPSGKHSMVIRKDHDYLNCKADNLKWVTPHDHKMHVSYSPKSVSARKAKAITISGTAKIFDEKKAKEVKKMIWDPNRTLTFKQIAKKFRVSEMQIYRIKSGELWYHVKVDNEPVTEKYKQNLKNIALQAKVKKNVPAAMKKQGKKARKALKKLNKRQ